MREELGNGDGVVVAMAGWQLWRVIQSQEERSWHGLAAPKEKGRAVERAGWQGGRGGVRTPDDMEGVLPAWQRGWVEY